MREPPHDPIEDFTVDEVEADFDRVFGKDVMDEVRAEEDRLVRRSPARGDTDGPV